jgi:CubicO group peptidase (beta-lactamase class C family)
MSNSDFYQTRQLLQKALSEQLYKGCQLFVLKGGEVFLDVAYGMARDDMEMAENTIMLWLSASKPVTAIAIARLYEQGKINIDAFVASYIPDFAANGKDKITVRHLLTHTAGLRGADNVSEELPWGEIIKNISQTKIEPNWIPGEKAGYHRYGSWYILGELVRKIDGRMVNEYIRDEIFIPLGMENSWLGIPIEMQKKYLISFHYITDENPPKPHPLWNKPESIARCLPPSNGRGPARELAQFYQMLLNGGELNGKRILKKQTVKEWTSRQRKGMLDHTFKSVVDWGYGFFVNSEPLYGKSHPYGYGAFASADTFGHSGAQCSCAFADPEHQLAVAFISNGRPGEARYQPHIRDLFTTLYKDLNLA